ncbi:unnamed protein product, partial [Polarella glacialis]
ASLECEDQEFARRLAEAQGSASEPSPGSSAAGKRPRSPDASALGDLLERLSDRGMRTAELAAAAGLSEDQVMIALTKRRRSDDPDHLGACGKLVRRLLADPRELCCPILQCLIEDPVVAEDGFTYERDAIQDSLQRRHRSPMTGAAMGPSLFPNHAFRAQIGEYKEKTVAEILVVVRRMYRLAADNAAELLQKAEDLIRPRLPESSARASLKELLSYRALLPERLRKDSVCELADLAALDGDNDRLREVVAILKDPSYGFGKDALQTFSNAAVHQLFHIIADSAEQPPPEHRKVLKLISKEQGRRLVRERESCRHDPRATEDDPFREDSLDQGLWTVAATLRCWFGASDQYSGPGDSSQYQNFAAAVLAQTFGSKDLELPGDEGLPHGEIELQPPPSYSDLRRAAELLEGEDPCQRCTEIVRDYLGIEEQGPAWDFDSKLTLAAVLMKLATGLPTEEATPLLIRARMEDPLSSSIRQSLLAALGDAQNAGGRFLDQGLLLTLAFEDAGDVSVLLVSRLDLERLHSESSGHWVPPEALRSLSERLAEMGRPEEGARWAVCAAQAHETAGDQVAASNCYIQAYRMDRANTVASHGVLESCARSAQEFSRVRVQSHMLQTRINNMYDLWPSINQRLTLQEQHLKSMECKVHALELELNLTGQLLSRYRWQNEIQLQSLGRNAQLLERLFPWGQGPHHIMHADQPQDMAWHGEQIPPAPPPPPRGFLRGLWPRQPPQPHVPEHFDPGREVPWQHLQPHHLHHRQLFEARLQRPEEFGCGGGPAVMPGPPPGFWDPEEVLHGLFHNPPPFQGRVPELPERLHNPPPLHRLVPELLERFHNLPPFQFQGRVPEVPERP